MNNRPSKRLRRSNMVVHINGFGSLDECDETTTVLNIRDNHSIVKIPKMNFLTIASFVNTVISNVVDSPRLHSITITNNSSIKQIELLSVIEVNLKDCPNLESIWLPNAITVSIDNCPKLTDIGCKHAIKVKLKNMSIEKRILNFKNTFPHMNSVILENVNGLKEYPIDELPISNLSLTNCDVEKISKIDGFENLFIENCNSLRVLEQLCNMISLKVVNCPYLYRVGSISVIDEVKLERCPALKGVAYIFASSMIIDYCFSLITLPSNDVKKLTIDRCPMLTSLHLCNTNTEVIIDHCEQLEFVEFNVLDAFSFSNLSFTIYGDNRLYDIKDWYVSKLTICDNPSIESINCVHNLTRLCLINCIDLIYISNLVILDNLTVEGCESLESIKDICGMKSCSFSHCDDLKEVCFYLTEIEELSVNDCENISLFINGSQLSQLKLINCGFVSISDMTPKTQIYIQNTRLLPDLISDINIIQTPLIDAEPVYPEAELLISHLHKLDRLSFLLANKVKTYRIRKKYLHYMNMLKSDSVITCCICLDDIIFSYSSMTHCSHVFHEECLDRWVLVRRACPLCNNVL